MKIIIEKNLSGTQIPIVTIDTEKCHSMNELGDAIELALEIDGYSKEAINIVFGRKHAVECKEDDKVTYEI